MRLDFDNEFENGCHDDFDDDLVDNNDVNDALWFTTAFLSKHHLSKNLVFSERASSGAREQYGRNK